MRPLIRQRLQCRPSGLLALTARTCGLGHAHTGSRFLPDRFLATRGFPGPICLFLSGELLCAKQW